MINLIINLLKYATLSFILCGGFGTRLDHEGKIKAKPMVEIGNKPILVCRKLLWQNFKEFIFCLGHNSHTIINYCLNNKKNIKL